MKTQKFTKLKELESKEWRDILNIYTKDIDTRVSWKKLESRINFVHFEWLL